MSILGKIFNGTYFESIMYTEYNKLEYIGRNKITKKLEIHF